MPIRIIKTSDNEIYSETKRQKKKAKRETHSDTKRNCETKKEGDMDKKRET